MRRPEPKRVVVIEDHEDSAEALSTALVQRGHDVAVAYRGAEGLAKARELKPHVVIADLSLPDITGLEVAQRLRADPDQQGLWLIAISAYAVPKLAKAAGFDEYVSKPADLDALALHLFDTPASPGSRNTDPTH